MLLVFDNISRQDPYIIGRVIPLLEALPSCRVEARGKRRGGVGEDSRSIQVDQDSYGLVE